MAVALRAETFLQLTAISFELATPDRMEILSGRTPAFPQVEASTANFCTQTPRRSVLAAPDGTPLWTSGSLPGSVHDLKVARIWGILRRLVAAGLITPADKGYVGADEHVRVPDKGRNKPVSQKSANRAHAKLRGPGERANAQLKTWRILRKLRCCPLRAGQMVKAVLVLQLRESR